MADIKTSISLNADASQAIGEMNKVKSAVQQLSQDAQNTVIKPTVDASAVQQLKEQLQSTTINVPVSATPTGGGAAVPSAVGPSAGEIATSTAAIISKTTELNLAQQSLNNTFKVSENTFNSLRIAAANVAQAKADLIGINSELQDVIAAVADAGEEANDADVERINVLSKQRDILAQVAKKHEEIEQATKERAAAEEKAAQQTQQAQSSLRSGINGLGEEYMRFSSGAAGGMDRLRSISLNILSDINLVIGTGKFFYELGNSIYHFVDAYRHQYDEIEKIARRTPEVQKMFEKLELKGKSPAAVIEELNKKIEETGKTYSDAITQAEALERQNQFVVGGSRKRFLEQADAAKTQLQAQQNLRSEIIKTEEEKVKRRADYSQLDLLDAETKIRRQAELDIAGLQDQLKSALSDAERQATNRLIEYRKQKMENDLKAYAELQQKQKDEELRKTLSVQDEARQAQINNMEGLAKVNAQFQFDMDKLGRRLAAAKTKEEQDAINQLILYRTQADLKNIKEVGDAKKRADDELAKKQKDDLRALMDLQRSQFEDMLSYQRQIVAGFNGLQQGLFPQEALQYLRQIAMGTNKITP